MLSTARNKLDSWTLIRVFGGLYLASQVAIGVIVQPLGSDMLAVQTTLSAEHVREIFASWQSAGLLPAYARHYWFDMIHPLWYGTFLAAALAKGFNANRVSTRFDALLILPFVAAGCDLVENLVHLSFLADRANITDARVLLGNGAALLKWLLSLSCLAAVIVLTARARRRTDAGMA
ncbi:MAG TPA: hypothetical protein VF331_27775 [Polyangiales bacterium]